MKQSRKVFAAVLVIVSLFAMSLPASAHEAPQALVCHGTAETSPRYPFLLPGPQDFDFSVNGDCETVPWGDSARISLSGSGNGWCWISTGSGTGTIAYPDGHRLSFSFAWSGGNILLVLGELGDGSTLVGVVQTSGALDCAPTSQLAEPEWTIIAAAAG
jgi:hypothetical protein